MWPWLKDMAATYTFKVEAAQPTSKRYCRYCSMSCQGSNSLSSHHIENAAQQLPYTTLVEGALAFRKVSQIEGPRSVESDQSLSMAIPRVEGGSRRMPNSSLSSGLRSAVNHILADHLGATRMTLWPDNLTLTCKHYQGEFIRFHQ